MPIRHRHWLGLLPGVWGALILASAQPSPAAPARLLVKGGTFLTMKPGQEDPFVGYMVIGADGKIAAIASGEPPVDLAAAATVDAAGKIIIPGFVSAHSHIWQTAFRGLSPNGWAALGWVNAVYQTQAVYGTPEDFYWFAYHGGLDLLRHGITSAYDFAYGRRVGGFQEQQLRGELDSGLRVVHGWIHPTNATAAEARAQLKAFLAFAEPYKKSPRLLGFSISGVATPAAVEAIDAALTKEYGFVNQTHYLETPVDQERQRLYFQNFVASHALGPSLYFGHFIHTDDAMLAAVGKAGGGMSWNPLSNGRLASGLADIPKYLKYGIKIGMGVDGQASADLPDPFANMRMGLYLIRAKYENGSVLKPIDVLRFHTLGSASVMRVDDRVGSLEPGKLGDFCLINPAAVDRGPVYDPYATLVFACNTQNLEGVYVGGQLVSTYSRLTQRDFAVAERELYERVARIRAQDGAAPGPVPALGNPPGVKPDPGPPRVAPAGAAAALAARDWAKAEELSTTALAQDSTNGAAYRIRGLARNRLKNYAGALEDFRRAVQLNSGDVEAVLGRGRAHRLLKDYDAAVADFSEAHEMAPLRGRPLCERGAILILQHKWEASLADYAAAARVEPDYPGLDSYFAEIYLYMRRPADALAAAQRGLRREPNALIYEINLAHSYLFLGRFEEAKALYLRYADVLDEGKQIPGKAIVRTDFGLMKEAGITTPDMAKIEAALGI